jgi:hypothetical protein
MNARPSRNINPQILRADVVEPVFKVPERC